MKRRSRKKLMSEINVVPYIDVMLVLLVIFIVTAPLLSQGVHVELPRTRSEPIDPGQKQQPVIVSVNVQGDYYIEYGGHKEDKKTNKELLRLVAGLLKHNPDTRIYVRGDGRVRYEQVVQLMALLQEAGVTGIGLMTDPPERG